jgi:hypothetical protein
MLARDEEERIGFELDDDLDLALEEDSESDQPKPWKKTNRRSYHDEFTDNDSDEYPDATNEAYGLHNHVERSA